MQANLRARVYLKDYSSTLPVFPREQDNNFMALNITLSGISTAQCFCERIKFDMIKLFPVLICWAEHWLRTQLVIPADKSPPTQCLVSLNLQKHSGVC